MNGLGELMQRNARAAGLEAVTVTVRVIVDPKKLDPPLEDGDTIHMAVADEIASNLESLPWVDSYDVRQALRP
jgi:hypothetical protein